MDRPVQDQCPKAVYSLMYKYSGTKIVVRSVSDMAGLGTMSKVTEVMSYAVLAGSSRGPSASIWKALRNGNWEEMPHLGSFALEEIDRRATKKMLYSRRGGYCTLSPRVFQAPGGRTCFIVSAWTDKYSRWYVVLYDDGGISKILTPFSAMCWVVKVEGLVVWNDEAAATQHFLVSVSMRYEKFSVGSESNWEVLHFISKSGSTEEDENLREDQGWKIISENVPIVGLVLRGDLVYALDLWDASLVAYDLKQGGEFKRVATLFDDDQHSFMFMGEYGDNNLLLVVKMEEHGKHGKHGARMFEIDVCNGYALKQLGEVKAECSLLDAKVVGDKVYLGFGGVWIEKVREFSCSNGEDRLVLDDGRTMYMALSSVTGLPSESTKSRTRERTSRMRHYLRC